MLRHVLISEECRKFCSLLLACSVTRPQVPRVPLHNIRAARRGHVPRRWTGHNCRFLITLTNTWSRLAQFVCSLVPTKWLDYPTLPAMLTQSSKRHSAVSALVFVPTIFALLANKLLVNLCQVRTDLLLMPCSCPAFGNCYVISRSTAISFVVKSSSSFPKQ